MIARAADRPLLAVALFGFLVSPVAAQVANSEGAAAPIITLTNTAQIVALGAEFPADRYQARFQGVVIYPSPGVRRLYVQDGDFAVQVNLDGSASGFQSGHLV